MYDILVVVFIILCIIKIIDIIQGMVYRYKSMKIIERN
jgi:hypothetical protein